MPKPSTANMTIALTMGDPSGIGPEITAAAWQSLRATGPAFVVLADPSLLSPIAPIRIVTEPDLAGFSDAIPVLPMALAAPAIPGAPNPSNAAAIIASIEQAVRLAQSGAASAVVTNPISKAVLNRPVFPTRATPNFSPRSPAPPATKS